MRVVILGCGTSQGVPVVGGPDGAGDWGDCDPDEPRNRRRRVSIVVEEAGRRILVDAGPDLREQLLDARVGVVDACLFTHAHADHIHGIDDLRMICQNAGAALPCWGSAETLDEIRARFVYATTPIRGTFYYKPVLDLHEIDGPFDAAGMTVVPFDQDHGLGRHTYGFRFGDFAYSTDVLELDARAFAILEGVRVWVVDCLQEAPNPAHAHLERTLDWIARVRPARAVLTHMNRRLDYRRTLAKCPPGTEPGYDGMVIDV